MSTWIARCSTRSPRARGVERRHAGVLLDNARDGGQRQVAHAVTRVHGADLAVAHAQGGIGVGIDRLATGLAVADQRLHVGRPQPQQLARALLVLGLQPQQRRLQPRRRLQQRIVRLGDLLRRGVEPAQALGFLVQRGTGVERIDVSAHLFGRAAKHRVELRHMLRRGQRHVLRQQVDQQRLLDALGVPALDLFEPTLDQRRVALLVARLALRIRLAALQRQALQAHRRTQQLRKPGDRAQ